MAAHRYWRVNLLGVNGTANGPISEIELRTSIGGLDATGSGTPSVAGSTAAGSAANLFDNSTATSWTPSSTQGNRDTITYDFGAGGAVDIAEVAITSTSAYPSRPAGAVAAVVVDYSDDNATWVSLAPAFDSTALVGGGTITLNGFVTVADRVVAAAALRVAPGWPAGGLRYAVTHDGVLRYDAVDGGVYSISGSVAIDATPDVPVHRQVRLFEKLTGRLVRETWSDATTGAYVFTNLKRQEYFVVTHDYTRSYNAAIKDAITPV